MEIQPQQRKINLTTNSIQEGEINAAMELNCPMKIKTEIEMEPEHDMNYDILGRISYPSDEAFNQMILYPLNDVLNPETAALLNTQPDDAEPSKEITSNTECNHEEETLEILRLEAELDNGKQWLQVKENDRGIADSVELKQQANEINKEGSKLPKSSNTGPKVKSYLYSLFIS